MFELLLLEEDGFRVGRGDSSKWLPPLDYARVSRIPLRITLASPELRKASKNPYLPLRERKRRGSILGGNDCLETEKYQEKHKCEKNGRKKGIRREGTIACFAPYLLSA